MEEPSSFGHVSTIISELASVGEEEPLVNEFSGSTSNTLTSRWTVVSKSCGRTPARNSILHSNRLPGSKTPLSGSIVNWPSSCSAAATLFFHQYAICRGTQVFF